MPEVHGEFRGDAPLVGVRIVIGPLPVKSVKFLLDTGAAHILMVFPSEHFSAEDLAAYARWPVEILAGVGTLPVRRAPEGILHFTNAEGQTIVVPVQPIHVLLYDVDDSGFAPLGIPPSLIGFQNAAFGLSQLLVDNANQRVALTYQEPFTPTRLE